MARDYYEPPQYHYYDYEEDERQRERERRHRRRNSHTHRPHDYDDDAAKRERRERRLADDARRQAEAEIDELRGRRGSYYSRHEPERRRDPERMAHAVRVERERPREEKKSRSSREVRRDGTRRKKRRDTVPDDRSDDDYVYGRRGMVEEVTVKRSHGSSSRTAYTPRSGSRTVSSHRIESPKIGRSVSAKEPSTRDFMSSRPSLRRSSTAKSPAAAPVLRSHSVRENPPRKSGGIFASLFRAPPRPAPVSHKEVPRVECLVCMADDLPANKTARLGCGHRMCHHCLKRQFTLSVNDPRHMPPRCCTHEHIPLKHVERLFDDKFKRQWNKKYQEYKTANRLYCPSKGCGEWIKPSKIRMDLTYGMKYARCGRCNTKVCVLCNKKFHTRRECPKDEETNRLVEMAKEQGWQRCYNCKAVVELKEGCNHMTCRCSAQFCMVCAAPWKTCNCPWFDYSHVEDGDRLNDMRVPHAPQRDVVEVVEMAAEPAPPPVRRSSTRSRRTRDRDLERADEALATHLQNQMRLDPNASERPRSDPNILAYGNAGGHHMNDSYAVRPVANTAARAAPRQPQRTSFFGRRLVREPARAPAPRPVAVVTASTMAGLSRDGTKRGANRVGTWLNHVEIDHDAIATAPRGVELDAWSIEGSMVGID